MDLRILQTASVAIRMGKRKSQGKLKE